MKNLILIYLFIFWTVFWSFASVLIYRLKSSEKWILFWRSHCKDCKKNLWAFELIPIFSWLKNFWKCKYCKSKISPIYPALEISTWLSFLWVWFFLIDFEKLFLFETFEFLKLFFWLSISFITILYIFYDLLFTEIHEWIMWVWIFLAILWLFWNNFWEINNLIFSQNIVFWNEIFFSIFILIISIIWFYVIMLKELNEIYDFLIIFFIWFLIYLYKIFFPESNFSENPILSWIIWSFCIFLFFFLQIFLSNWRALWWWDLRIWIMIWLILWINFSFTWIFLSYVVWSIIWIFLLIKNKKSKMMTEIAFWPFLWIWFFLTIFFKNEINNFIINYFSIV